jgi:hypothetical protein
MAGFSPSVRTWSSCRSVLLRERRGRASSCASLEKEEMSATPMRDDLKARVRSFRSPDVGGEGESRDRLARKLTCARHVP